MLKLTTDKHEASRGLSATAELVPYQTGWRYSDGNPPNGGVECRWGRQKSRFWAYLARLALVPAVKAAASRCCKHGRRSPVDHGHRLASMSVTSLVVSVRADCGRRRRNVYDKKPQLYAKDNSTAYLTAHSDKSVAYNNKRLYSTFCTVEANYWQTLSIARPLCDSRATCLSRTRLRRLVTLAFRRRI